MFLIMTHDRGENNEQIHKLAWDTFIKGTELAKKLKLYGAGQDLLTDAFSGNIKGAGPGSAEMEIDERPSEPIIVFMGDKTSAGAFNLPLYKMFADPFNTPGLVIGEPLHDGFSLRDPGRQGASPRSPSTPRMRSTTCSSSSALPRATRSSASSTARAARSRPVPAPTSSRSSRAATSARTTRR